MTIAPGRTGRRARVFLCEKPSQARDIARVLGCGARGDGCLRGNGVVVTWCFGHLLEMAPPDSYGEVFRRWSLEALPIIPDAWRYEPRKEAAKQLKVIRGLLAEAGEVVIATDADREGETIAREVLERFRWRGPVQRLWLSALDDASIRKALASMWPGERTEPLYRAGIGRARADWLVGMNLTRAYTVLARGQGFDGVLSVGRVQTPTLRLVVDRDREIEAFKPRPYWEVVASFGAPGESGSSFRAKWLPPEEMADSEGRCISEPAARTLAQRVAGGTGRVADAQTRRVREAPPLPFDLGTLQQEASRRYGMGAQEVLDAAQSLYEKHKATTYPRTDCPYLPESMLAEAPRVLEALRQSDGRIGTLVERADRAIRSRAWNDGKITAHHAIIPTTAPCGVAAMGEAERRVYDLVRRRYLAQFYPRHEYDVTTVTLAVGGDYFRATGRRVVVAGWRALFGRERTEEGEDEAQELPELRQGDGCRVLDAEVASRQTRPPARYTEGTLIAAMKNAARLVEDARLKRMLKETAGLGTEATRAGIIRTLLDRRYVEKHKQHLVSTETGRALIDALPGPVKDPGTTALWEQALDEIAQGAGNLEAFLARQTEWVRQLVERARTGSGAVGVASERPACPDCGRPLRRLRRNGSTRHFWGCSGYPECGTTLPDQGGKPGRPLPKEPVGQCRCGGAVKETPRAWSCQACGATVWRETAGKRLTQKQALALLAGQVVRLQGLKSRAGKVFEADARIEEGKVRLLFGSGETRAGARRSRGHAATDAGPGR